jgi:mycoredoxin
MVDKFIVYGSKYCGMVPTVRKVLDQAHVVYEYVDIHADPEGKRIVREINNGYESVPTLVFPDGSTLTEPTQDALHAKLEEMGISAERLTALDHGQLALVSPWVRITAVVLALVGLAAGVDVLLAFGVLVLLASLLAGYIR